MIFSPIITFTFDWSTARSLDLQETSASAAAVLWQQAIERLNLITGWALYLFLGCSMCGRLALSRYTYRSVVCVLEALALLICRDNVFVVTGSTFYKMSGSLGNGIGWVVFVCCVNWWAIGWVDGWDECLYLSRNPRSARVCRSRIETTWSRVKSDRQSKRFSTFPRRGFIGLFICILRSRTQVESISVLFGSFI